MMFEVKTMKQFITGFIIAGFLVVHVTLANAGTTLEPAQLKNLIPGRYKVTLMGVSNMTVLLRSNGTILGSAKGTIDNGHWTLSGNKICIGWSKWLSGSTRCSSLLRAAGYYQGSGFTMKPI